MASEIQIIGGPEIIVRKAERWGGVDYYIELHPNFSSLMSWAHEYRLQVQKETMRRNSDPTLAHLYDQYKAYLHLTNTDPLK